MKRVHSDQERRSVSTAEKRVSPPPIKRKRQEHAGPLPSTSANPPRHRKSIRIFSWNINGLSAFIPAASAPITSYFKPVGQSSSPAGSASDARPANSLRSFLARHSWPEVLFLQELKIKPQDHHKSQAAVLSALNSPQHAGDIIAPETTYTVEFNLPRDEYNAKGFQGQLYGVGTILRSDFASKCVSRVRGADWDLEGRVTIVETGKASRSADAASRDDQSKTLSRRSLALLNVYAVNGTDAPYRSPKDGRTIGTRHDFKLAFHTRLRDECLDLERRGFDVLVAGDLNIARGLLDGHPNLRTWPAQHCANRADFNTKFFGSVDNQRSQAQTTPLPKSPEGPRWENEASQGDQRDRQSCLDAVDVFRAIKGTERKHTYYPRNTDWGTSCDRVDLIIAGKSLWNDKRVLDTGILDSPLERGPSDHVPLWVELAVEDE